VEGQPVCVVGRTSEEEGDDKLFVEKAYLLTPENASVLARQMASRPTERPQSFGQVSQNCPVPKPASAIETVGEDVFEIIVSAEQVKAKADAIKNILKKYPGDKPVVLKVGEKIIKTSFKVDDCQELKGELLTVIPN